MVGGGTIRRNVLAICACAALAGCARAPREPAVMATGLVDATEIDVASKVPGRIAAVPVREGDRVAAGQPVAEILSEEIEAKLAQVQSVIEASQARLRMARNGARDEEKAQARIALVAARHQAELARKMHDRLAALARDGSAPQATFDNAETQYKLAMDQLAIAEARYAMVRHGARDEEVEALEALVRQAEGTLAEVRSYEAEKVQEAPIAGEVAKVVLHAGELAATGHPIVTLVDIDNPWATFAVREDLLRDVRIGTRFRARVPALDRTLEFEVFHVAALGDFATWKATSEKNAFDLKSFEVKARPVTPAEGLRPGMTVRWLAG